MGKGMAHSHKNRKDFLLGALIGGAIGVAAAALSRKKKGSSKQIIDMISNVGKVITSPGSENNLSEILNWTAEGIHLWNKLKKGS
jgi:gas vesicle protein